MASSPPSPFPASLPNPRKRASMSSQASLGGNKRPKLHPLRQTSFPNTADPTNYAVAGARSETGRVANSAFSTASNKQQPRGRGRPKKSLQIPEDDARSARESGSTTGKNKDSQAKSVISAVRSSGGQDGEDEADQEDEEEDEEPEGDEAQADEQKRMDEKINILRSQMTSAQAERWNALRGSVLNPRMVKKIINQTVSQSVPGPCVHTVQWGAKAFGTEIIERAREVQAEWALAMDAHIKKVKLRQREDLKKKEQELEAKEKASRLDRAEDAVEGQFSNTERLALRSEIKKASDEVDKYIPNKHKGGLLPDHLREALRRYKADGDGGGSGFEGLSHPLLGVQGSVAWRLGEGAAGRRLFR